MLCRVILLRRNAAAQKHTKVGRVSTNTRPASCSGSFILIASRLSDESLKSLLLPELEPPELPEPPPLDLLAEADEEGPSKTLRNRSLYSDTKYSRLVTRHLPSAFTTEITSSRLLAF